MNTEILKIENETIECPIINGVQYIAVKPICTILDIDWKRQSEVLKSNPLYSSVMDIKPITGADGKRYDMTCLPIEYILGWIMGIHPNKVTESAREQLMSAQRAVIYAISETFIPLPSLK